ncbi:unnamed protein product [Kuraishia capsulata CBS 1993]|uniref:Phosphoserine aminotransferase n=1 Tax=Kuraishia capsulata CBS 1993 TaxID=1382522 RepID=W6MKZ8_9ASCO|nr:uncharacterized protein KUCA_T00002727001 [Kuraishia capsulata CBS 1993]CDK26753.1 unnamed protein product [Kuraishia capsulata CBS 1993]
MSRELTREEPNYFGAGPALLPTEVLQTAAYDLLNFNSVGLGIGEISHRSGPATEVINSTKQHFKDLLDIPDTHEVFFMQGGGTSGFSSIATNLAAAYLKKTGKPGKAGYVITGTWSKKSYEEAVRLGVDSVVVCDAKKLNGSFGDIPSVEKWSIPDLKDTSYVYFCDNETVNGIEFPDFPFEKFPDVEIVADMSSNILSKKLDISKYGLIMAGAQKNVGLAGISIYIIKKSLLEQPSDAEIKAAGIPLPPIAFHYPTVVANNSAYNTIPIFTLHIVDLVLQSLLKKGGITFQQELNEKKAKLLYETLDAYPTIFNLPVAKAVRSKMNVVFTLKDTSLDSEFLKQGEANKLTGLKGHRSVGGMRASLYNAVSLKSVELLVAYIKTFAESHK